MALRREIPALGCIDRKDMTINAFDEKRVLALTRRAGNNSTLCVWNFSESAQEVVVELANGHWPNLFDSSAAEWGGKGETAHARLTVTEGRVRIPIGAWSFAVYVSDK
nr:DUF3459 domain-containing protein [Geotalea toluenoxydans]